MSVPVPRTEDDVYALKARAGAAGHATAGQPQCLCGARFDSHADLDAHLLTEGRA